MKKRIYTPEEKEEILRKWKDLRKEGVPINEIVNKLKVSKATVGAWLNKEKYGKNHKKKYRHHKPQLVTVDLEISPLKKENVFLWNLVKTLINKIEGASLESR